MTELLFPTPLLAHSDMGFMNALSVHQQNALGLSQNSKDHTKRKTVHRSLKV
jgi:hypothetical protein